MHNAWCLWNRSVESACYNTCVQGDKFSSTSICSESVTNKRSGVFGSPGWPKHYHIRSFPSDRKCIWRAVNQTIDERVQINIMDLDVASYGSTCGSSTDLVEFTGGWLMEYLPQELSRTRWLHGSRRTI